MVSGGNFRRFIIWTEGAFKKLNEIYGSLKGGSAKKGYRLPRAAMENADVARIINSDEVQSVLLCDDATSKHYTSRSTLSCVQLEWAELGAG